MLTTFTTFNSEWNADAKMSIAIDVLTEDKITILDQAMSGIPLYAVSEKLWLLIITAKKHVKTSITVNQQLTRIYYLPRWSGSRLGVTIGSSVLVGISPLSSRAEDVGRADNFQARTVTGDSGSFSFP